MASPRGFTYRDNDTVQTCKRYPSCLVCSCGSPVTSAERLCSKAHAQQSFASLQQYTGENYSFCVVMPEGRPAEGQEAVHTDQDPLLTGEAQLSQPVPSHERLWS